MSLAILRRSSLRRCRARCWWSGRKRLPEPAARQTHTGLPRERSLKAHWPLRPRPVRRELLNMPRKSSEARQPSGRYRSILVPLDGSRLSEQALPLAVAIAERARAKLRLVLVSIPAIPPGASTAERRGAAALRFPRASRPASPRRHTSRHSPINSRTVLCFGDHLNNTPGPVAEDPARVCPPEQERSCGHDQSWPRRFAAALARQRCRRHDPRKLRAGLLVRPEENPSPQPVLENLSQILVPVDGSALAETILEPAKELASLAGAELMLVEVIQPLASPLETPARSAFEIRRRADQFETKGGGRLPEGLGGGMSEGRCEVGVFDAARQERG